jgi:AcrR family transcriptional regulator
MTSKRHTTARAAPNRVDDDRLLDAARESVLSVGVRRTTLAEVARLAEVSRMTLYRRFPDVRSLLAELMTRQFGALLGREYRLVEHLPVARRRLIEGAVGSIRALAEDPVMRAVLDLDGEVLMPYVVQRSGRVQLLADQFLAAQVVDGHADGSVREGDAGTQARALRMMLQSFVLSLRTSPDDVPVTALLDELDRTLEAGLRP